MKFGKKGGKNATNIPARRRDQGANNAVNSRPSAQELSDRYAFRRNRTITGSSSAQIMSSNELNAQLVSPRAHVHHLTSLRRRLLFYFLLVGAVAFGLYILLSNTVASETIQVKDAPVLTESQQDEYRTTMEEYYNARPLERLAFVLNEDRLTSHMQAEHPEVKALSVQQTKIGEALVSITVRQPLARWSINSSDQYVDGEGVIFTTNYFAAPSLQIVDESGVQVGSGQLVASNRFLGFVGRLLSSAHDRGLAVVKVTLPVATTRQVEVIFEGKPTKYKISVDRSAGQQVEDISHIIPYLDSHGLTPEYVDVRLESKAFYK